MAVPEMGSGNAFKGLVRRVEKLERTVREGLSSVQRMERVTIGKGGIKIAEGGIVEAVGGILRSRYIFLRGELFPATVQFYNDLAGTKHFVGDLDGTEVGVFSDWGPVALRSALKDVRLDHTVNTSATANGLLDATTGRVQRTGSALRWKDDIQDVELDLDDVRWFIEHCGKTWHGIYDPEGSGRGIGDIADYLAVRPTLRQFVVFNEDGETENIKYDRLYIVLARFLRDLDVRVTELEAGAT